MRSEKKSVSLLIGSMKSGSLVFMEFVFCLVLTPEVTRRRQLKIRAHVRGYSMNVIGLWVFLFRALPH